MIRNLHLSLCGMSAIAFAAADTSGGGASSAPDYSKLRTHDAATAALGDTAKPEGWDDMPVAAKRDWLVTNKPVTGETKTEGSEKPEVKTSGTESATAQASASPETIAEKTANATHDENPASTTRADDPARDSTVPATTTAEDNLAATEGGTGDKPEDPENPALGNRHSHPAQTTAEATLAAQEAAQGGIAMGGGLPAAEAADPANQPKPGEGLETIESRHDESGALQDATREALGSGTGAPDGNTGAGTDPSLADALAAPAPGEGTVPDGGVATNTDEEVEPVELKNGEVLKGGRAKLYRLLEKGATHEEMLAETGWTSALGAANVIARRAGMELEVTKGKDKAKTRTYKLKAPA